MPALCGMIHSELRNHFQVSHDMRGILKVLSVSASTVPRKAYKVNEEIPEVFNNFIHFSEAAKHVMKNVNILSSNLIWHHKTEVVWFRSFVNTYTPATQSYS